MVVAFDGHTHDSLLTLAQAAQVAGVHPTTIRAWCASGRLPSVRVDRRGARRIHPDDISRLAATRSRRLTLVARGADRAGKGAGSRSGRRTTAANRPAPGRQGDALRRLAT